VLQGHLQDAHTQVALGTAFAQTYWWVMAVTVIALIPTVALMRIERRARQQTGAIPIAADTAVLEAA
jgi:hypothetical protein